MLEADHAGFTLKADLFQLARSGVLSLAILEVLAQPAPRSVSKSGVHAPPRAKPFILAR